MLEVLVGLPQNDGSLSYTEKVVVYLINRPSVTSISPLTGFSMQQRDIRIIGTNFINLDSLHAKLTFQGNAPDHLVDCLTITNEILIIKAPDANNIALYEDRTMNIYISSNGMDYSTESFVYTFMDEPHITSLVVYESDFEGNILTEAVGLYFTDDVTHCIFGTQTVPATFNSTTGNVECIVPAYDRYGDYRFKLKFFNFYEVNNTEIYFTYKSLEIITDFTPKQGHVSGGNDVIIQGNFTILDGETFQIFFGDIEATSFTLDSDLQITVVTPTVVAPISVELKIIHNGETYSTQSISYKFKDYFQVTGITPTSGPSRGGTVVHIAYTGTIGESIYCVFGDEYSVPIIGKLLIVNIFRD
jgi:hypothetical protein